MRSGDMPAIGKRPNALPQVTWPAALFTQACIPTMVRYLSTLPMRDPLMAITLIALVPRLLAAIFSEGYFAHDDHFLVIEAAAELR